MATTYERCVWLRDTLVTRAAEVIAYQRWSDEFAVSRLREAPKDLRESEGFEFIDPNDLAAEEMDALGFGRWSEEYPIRLIPLWLLPFLAEEFEAACLYSAPRRVRRDEIDNDHRFGCLAYGVLPTIPTPEAP